jgi:hypothetical protein
VAAVDRWWVCLLEMRIRTPTAEEWVNFFLLAQALL